MAHRSRQLDQFQVPPIQALAKKKHVYIWHCCYCGRSSIPISCAGCPGCGYGRCAYCTTTRVQVRSSAARSQIQATDYSTRSMQGLSPRTLVSRLLPHSTTYNNQFKPPSSGINIERENQQALDTIPGGCGSAAL